ncbi:MAG: hypothetical protein K1W17_08765 [Oscillospiraceae bacterium]
MINVLEIRRILISATKSDILIVTETSEESRIIRREIREYTEWYMPFHVPVWEQYSRITVGGYYDIYAETLSDWNKEVRYKPFSGAVFITDKRLSGVKNIAEGVPVKLLPVERSGENAEMP